MEAVNESDTRSARHFLWYPVSLIWMKNWKPWTLLTSDFLAAFSLRTRRAPHRCREWGPTLGGPAVCIACFSGTHVDLGRLGGCLYVVALLSWGSEEQVWM